MKVLRSLVAAAVMFSASGVSASEIDELKAMILEMKQDYETKIGALEAKIVELEAGQQKTDMKLAETVSSEATEDSRVEYVGRHNAEVGEGGVVIKNPFGFGDVSLGGYFDIEYQDVERNISTFQQHRFIINIGAELTDRLRFNSEYEIEYGGSNAPGGGGEDKLEYAAVDYLINDAVNIRAGALLVPFGRFNLYHDSDLQDLTARPILARDITPTTWTEAGGGFFGEFNPIIGSYEDLMITYEAYVMNGLDTGFSDTGMGGGRNSLKVDNNDGKSLVARVTASPKIGHEIGLSGYTGEYNTNGDKIQGLGIDAFHAFGPLEVLGEYAFFDVDEPAGSNVSNNFDGAYLQTNYHFWFDGLNDTFLGRGFENPTFTLVGRYDWGKIDDDSDGGTGDNEEKRYTIGLNYRPIESFVWKFEYFTSQVDNEALEYGDNEGFLASMAFGF